MSVDVLYFYMYVALFFSSFVVEVHLVDFASNCSYTKYVQQKSGARIFSAELLPTTFYGAIKLICNQVIHESEIVCRFLSKKHSLKHRLDLSTSIEKTSGFNPWMTRLQINLIALYHQPRHVPTSRKIMSSENITNKFRQKPGQH
jgi:hypothetical protein